MRSLESASAYWPLLPANESLDGPSLPAALRAIAVVHMEPTSNIQRTAGVILAALEVLHSSPADKTSRDQAQETLQHVKDSLSPTAAIELAELLLQSLLRLEDCRDVEPLIHFGYHVLDERVLCAESWTSLADTDRLRLRRLAMLLLSAVATKHGRGYFPPWTRQKSAALVAALAIREWPQNWPDFTDCVCNCADLKWVADVVCDIFRKLSEDVYDFGDQIVAARRQELLKALSLSLDQILAFVKSAAELYLESRNLAELKITLHAMEAILKWCDLEKALVSNVPSACLAMLNHPGARDAAFDALFAFSSRKLSGSQASAANQPVTLLMRDILFPAMVDLIRSTSLSSVSALSLAPSSSAVLRDRQLQRFPGTAMAENQGIDDDEHRFHVRFVNLLADLGNAHFAACFLPFSHLPRELPLNHQLTATNYAEYMLAALAHPSVAIRDACMRFFTGAFISSGTMKSLDGALMDSTEHINSSKRHKGGSLPPAHGSVEAAAGTEFGKQLLARLALGFINSGTVALIKLPGLAVVRSFALVDCDGDEQEQSDTVSDVRNRVINTMAAASVICPEEAIQLAIRRLHEIFGSLMLPPAENGSPVFAVSVEERQWRQVGIVPQPESPYEWSFLAFGMPESHVFAVCADAATAATEAVVAGLVAARFFEIRPDMSQLLQRAYTCIMSVDAVELSGLKARALRIFASLFSREEQLFQESLDYLARVAMLDAVESDTKTKACSSIAVLCRRVGKIQPRFLQGIRTPLCEFAAHALSSERFSLSDRCQLLESACSCVLTLSDVSEAAAWFETLLEPLLTRAEFLLANNSELLQSPAVLFNFIEGKGNIRVSEIMTSIYLLQTATHQITRTQSYSAGPIKLPMPLSRSIAPRLIELGARLISVVHAMHNEQKFPLLKEYRCQSALLPTSSEIVNLLNLDGSLALSAIHLPPIYAATGATHWDVCERADDTLARFGLKAPDAKHRETREAIRYLRVGAYELVRNGILSGVTSSPVHLAKVLTSVCSDYHHLEPHHLYYLTDRIIRKLLCFPVVSVDPSFLSSVSASCVPRIIDSISENIEAFGTGQILSSESPVMDLVREHCREKLSQSASDLLVGLFPKVPSNNMEVDCGLPPTLNPNTEIGVSLWRLFRVVCGSGVATIEGGHPSRSVCELIARVTEHAPDEACTMFVDLLIPCLQCAVHSYKASLDGAAINSIVSICSRYRDASKSELLRVVAKESEEVEEWIEDALGGFFSGSFDDENNGRRAARQSVRKLAKMIAERTGVILQKKKNVQALPTPLVVRNPARQTAVMIAGDRDDELAEHCLDSLFGAADPL